MQDLYRKARELRKVIESLDDLDLGSDRAPHTAPSAAEDGRFVVAC